MLKLEGKLLEVKELPARDPFPASALVTVLGGTETFRLVGKVELISQLAHLDEFDDVVLNLRVREIDLTRYGAKGRAHKLSIESVVEDGVGR